MNNRLPDLLISVPLALVSAPVLIFACLMILVVDRVPPLYFSQRFGKDRKLFWMPKLRTMRVDTPQVETALLQNPSDYYTRLGLFLRKSSMDELPQLFSVIAGRMSLVGPRPALHNQVGLIGLRDIYGLNAVRPGLTGLAQVLCRDQISDRNKVRLEYFWFKRRNKVRLYFYLVIITIVGLPGASEKIKH